MNLRIASLSTILGFSAFSLALPVSGMPTSGTIVYVEDGDTLTVLDESRRQHRIRLADLDAPERAKPGLSKPGQPFSDASGRNLAQLAKGRAAKLQCFEQDDFGRSVCRVFVNGQDVSLEQIRAGYAWSAKGRFLRDSRAPALEEEARRARRGLWSQKDAIEPWMWRRQCWQKGQCQGAGD